jgi:DNA-binding MarR family transcriptional regulator
MKRERGINFRALSDFRYEIRRFLNFSEQAARTAGVEPHQHQALLAIKGLPAGAHATVGWLAERLQTQHHSTVELTNRLESKGLIIRSRSRTDRREILLHVTNRGEKLLQVLSVHHRAELRTAGPRLLKALRGAIRRNTNLSTSKNVAPHKKRRKNLVESYRRGK